MKKYEDIIGKIYLYIFSTLGLILLIIGSTGMINLGLKNMFNVSDPWESQPTAPYWAHRIETLTSCDDISEEDKVLMSAWLEEYKAWDAKNTNAVRKYHNAESMARNLALILVGLPLFLLHWRLIRKKYD